MAGKAKEEIVVINKTKDAEASAEETPEAPAEETPETPAEETPETPAEETPETEEAPPANEATIRSEDELYDLEAPNLAEPFVHPMFERVVAAAAKVGWELEDIKTVEWNEAWIRITNGKREFRLAGF